MIYILFGDDNLKKKIHVNKYISGNPVYLPVREASPEILYAHSEHISLFGDKSTIIIDNIISEKEEILTKELLKKMQESDTLFILLENNLLAPQIKKYKTYSDKIEEFKDNTKKSPKSNPFLLTDLFFKRDRLGAWLTYREQIESGESAEAISGMLFWRVKKALLSGERSNFKEEELKNIATRLVRDYHRSHSGECDLAVALEENILSVL